MHILARRTVSSAHPPGPTRSPPAPAPVREDFRPAIFGALAELPLDAQQAIVLSQALRARDGADFDLGGRGGHSQINQGIVFRFARARADDGAVAVLLRQAD